MSADLEGLGRLAADEPGLELLVLFGSRSRGDAHAGSDWDFGFVARAGFDADPLLATLVEALGTERVDLVDLARAGALLRFRAAREGRLLHEEQAAFERFRYEASSFWCEVEPVLRQAYADVLEGLG